MTPEQPVSSPHAGKPNPLLHKRRYRRLFLQAGVSIGLTAVIPLIIMTVVNYHQYRKAFHSEMLRPITRIAASTKRALEYNLSERVAALSLVIRDKSPEELRDPVELKLLLHHMKESFGGIIDLGVIDADGRQLTYAGPYNLQGKNYMDQDWFHAVLLRGQTISDVFLGHRRFPHFIIAVRDETPEGDSYVLRATIDSEMISRLIGGTQPTIFSDVFIVNRKGVLQTPSHFYGRELAPCALPLPPFSDRAEVLETEDEQGRPLVLGYAYIDRSPFVLMQLARPGSMTKGWLALRTELIVFLITSVVLVLGVVIYGTRYMVNSIREVDLKRANIFHKMEYTNKMAAIGRLGAGVAHEINNPLAIISEKAGLLKDLFTFSDKTPPRDKTLALVESILKSVERCSTITHRLLSFAKHMDVKHEAINLELLIKEVLSFLEKEAIYRELQIDIEAPEDLPTIESDRGQLQQVFLNIINNAFAAVEDKGHIRISMRRADSARVAVAVTDNGSGIPEDNLENIFEPFFTTKKGYGTGLGLSITYGIVEKLGGKITVDSKRGEGTTFTVFLPTVKGYS